MEKTGLNNFYTLLFILLSFGGCVNSNNEHEVAINCEKIMIVKELDSNTKDVYFILNFENKTNDTIRFINSNEIGEYSMNYVVNTRFNLKYSNDKENLKTVYRREFLLPPKSDLKQLYIISKSLDIAVTNIDLLLEQGQIEYNSIDEKEISAIERRYRTFNDSVRISMKNVPIQYISKKIDFEEAMQLIGGKKIKV
ncbi:hypothetical protein [Flavobacterium sp. NKUCC04_CG]|uniref:hypothetical protein n=1 Tax=Flavobacterium sp. NKUCC04_CG TaxID=2842121 RepID=UPI001C5B60CC|nr:hypothetical protein [Flavobacterium sp. NKUCC04_CG]MBW3519064.1 hypothetical protein [Flavobacterium sp. NKUCC04_CG]